MSTPPPPSAQYFDEWYANMAVSPARAEVVTRTLGLPPEVESTSLLPWIGIADVVDAVQVHAGDVLVDLGCGRGGYGLEVARRTGAALIGIDFSAVAVERARHWAQGAAEFRVGELAATGLPDAAADAVMSIDAMQFAAPYADGLRECRRILAPGGRLVLTGWQPFDLDDADVPARIRRDIAAELQAAGFEDVRVTHRPEWRAAERAHWEAAVALDPVGDPALQSFHGEGVRTLTWLERSQRVLARAVAPAAS